MVLPRFAAVRPAALMPCATPADVAAALRAARAGGHPVAVRGGGHCFAGRSTGTGVVIDTTPMSGVRLDGDRAVIGAGTRLAEVYDALAEAGVQHQAGRAALEALEQGDLRGIARRMYNVFEDALPRRFGAIGELKSRLLDLGALGAVMSGTGSAVFGIFETPADAQRAHGKMTSHCRDSFFLNFAAQDVG